MNLTRRNLLYLPLATAMQGAAAGPDAYFDHYFLEITRGFLRNARKTSSSFAVCDFPDGTILKTRTVGKSGKTYISVSRMLPALAAWVAGGKQPAGFDVEGTTLELIEVLRSIFENAFEPSHPDYWLEASRTGPDQRQPEASLVAWSLWLLGDRVLSRLSSQGRRNVQAWLASCTRVPVRDTNFAWFSAVNQGARLALSRRWPEFAGDEGWMLEDLKAAESLAAPGNDGWYSDSRIMPVYDYYNFWVFASHFLYWNRMVGGDYPEWAARFGDRLRLFLEKAPHFFGANGSHVLFGRSLIYRWAVLTPLVLAYEQKLWPHSPGLLRRIVRGNLQFLWGLGAFDKQRGKLRETFSAQGAPGIAEDYIDNGHPYWGMQAFAFFLIPRNDPFWTAPEEPLPAERGDFQVRLEGPRMLLVGTKSSGQVRWLQSQNEQRNGPGQSDAHYRDKYTKFSYSSHFPFNILKQEDRCAWDQALIFRNLRTGASAGRTGVKRGALIADGLQIEWWSKLGRLRFEVTSRIRISGEFEKRTHTIVAPAGAIEEGFEIEEGSYPLGLAEGEKYHQERGAGWQLLRSRQTGYLIASWNGSGYQTIEIATSFEETRRPDVNVVYARMAVNSLRAPLTAARITVRSLHYASPRPMPRKDMFQQASKLLDPQRGTGRVAAG